MKCVLSQRVQCKGRGNEGENEKKKLFIKKPNANDFEHESNNRYTMLVSLFAVRLNERIEY